MISIDELRNRLEYKDGFLYYKTSPSTKHPVGSRAGSQAPHNTMKYLYIKLDYDMYLTHRVIFALVHGYWPEFVDHKNGVKTDNRIENLRGCTQSQNLQNAGPSGRRKYKGVYNRGGRSFTAAFTNALGERKHLGSFPTAEAAAEAFNRAVLAEHGEFAYLNKIPSQGEHV